LLTRRPRRAEAVLKTIDLFLGECCLVARNAGYAAAELYLAYVRWALYNGVPVQDQFSFIDRLKRRGLKYRQRKDGSWFQGVAVLLQYRADMAESHE
jgi:hypothetical protein